ncbi:PHD finger protein EHD3 isoform X2 [Ricinus communis]|uniref:PHD finger protein EHD3 isoform X2 n=1 Tax=Ricinus communis TaxID=3988 RepID=UPI0007721B01|nr:PHD finger protein EHD3 isoform X2 [Ricinus communis]|eukprot:XP_015575407.1 PHD finger protein EHD3 isoform X2 [Ricinus communis]
MGGEEGTSNGDSAGEGFQCLKIGPFRNGFIGIRIGNDSSDCGLGSSEGLRTYKRRKRTRSSSENKGQEDGRGSVEAASKLATETAKEAPYGIPDSHASLDGSNDVLHKESRNFVLENIYQSLTDNHDGIQGCIQDTHMMTIKDSDAADKDRNTWSSQLGWMPNGTHYAARGNIDVTLNKSLDDSQRSVTEMCQHAFANIIISEKFSLLCKLLSENFQEMKPDNFLSLSRIKIKMKDGVYERSPMLFYEDIQRVWKKLQGIGNELISLAKSLSDVSSTSYDEQFHPQESHFHGKPEQIEACGAYSVCTCRRCGGKADGRNCLVCDSCEEMYHVSCIEPVVKEIPSKSWYCASCSAAGMGSPHENCAVCERLNAPRNLCTQASDEKGSPTIENGSEFEEASNHIEDGFHQSPAGGKNVCFCKMCGSEVENGEKVKICEHILCPYKYYHVRCLTNNLLKSYGPRWYCPSCLCRTCFVDRDDDQIVLCDGCDHAYHMYCMSPPRTSIPRGKWFCRQCDVKIKEIRRAKRAYEKREKRLEKKAEADKRACENLEKKLDEKCEKESGNGRLDILLTAAFNL